MLPLRGEFTSEPRTKFQRNSFAQELSGFSAKPSVAASLPTAEGACVTTAESDSKLWSTYLTPLHAMRQPYERSVHAPTAILERCSINLDDRALKDGLRERVAYSQPLPELPVLILAAFNLWLKCGATST